jgi:hypothetical protein
MLNAARQRHRSVKQCGAAQGMSAAMRPRPLWPPPFAALATQCHCHSRPRRGYRGRPSLLANDLSRVSTNAGAADFLSPMCAGSEVEAPAQTIRLLGRDVPVLPAANGTLRAHDDGTPASAKSPVLHRAGVWRQASRSQGRHGGGGGLAAARGIKPGWLPAV